MTVKLEEMTWPEVQQILKERHVVILPVGSLEEHGGHLPLSTDSLEATYYSEEAAKKITNENDDLYVLVAPTIHYGDVSIHKMFPGTIGVSVNTLVETIYDIVVSFINQGFKIIIVCNNHSENNCSIETGLHKVAESYPNARIYGICPIRLGLDVRGPDFIKAGKAGMGHALEVETDFMLAVYPQQVKMDKVIKGHRELPISEKYIGPSGMDQSKGVIYCSGIKGWEESGTIGDPTKSSAEQGEKLNKAVINDFVNIIMQIVKSEL